MQPYFFPYIEYFRLIAACDIFVVFDTAQFSRGTWMSRNRLLNREKGWAYFGIPVTSQGKRVAINNAIINYSSDWRQEILNKLQIYRNSAHFAEAITLISDLLGEGHRTLADFNVASLRRISCEIGAKTEIVRLSELGLPLPERCPPGEWALHICKALNATEYRNPSGGRDIYDAEVYRHAGIHLSFHEHIELKYDTGPFEFVPDLSIIDVLMWVDLDTIRQIIRGAKED